MSLCDNPSRYDNGCPDCAALRAEVERVTADNRLLRKTLFETDIPSLRRQLEEAEKAERNRPMLCFAHGGSAACEASNKERGYQCPKCVADRLAAAEAIAGAIERLLAEDGAILTSQNGMSYNGQCIRLTYSTRADQNYKQHEADTLAAALQKAVEAQEQSNG